MFEIKVQKFDGKVKSKYCFFYMLCYNCISFNVWRVLCYGQK